MPSNTTLTIKDAAAVNRTVKAELENDGTTYIPYSRVKALSVFRDNCSTFTTGDQWDLVKATNDLFLVSGNTAGASWYDLSLDPFSTGTESSITTVQDFALPLEVCWGIHTSQRTLGQDISMEIVDVANSISATADMAIASIAQGTINTTTLSVTTSSANTLVVGDCFGVFGCLDSRANYPSLVVSKINSATSFEATAGPGGTIPALTYSATSGTVYMRRRTGLSANATSMILENTTVTNASFYNRAGGSSCLQKTSIATNHSVTTLSTASAQAVNLAYAYAFVPTNEFKCSLTQDRVVWSDSVVDPTAYQTHRLAVTQKVPSATSRYKLRIRAANNKGLTTKVGNISLASKSGGTTATITTAAAHGLNALDLVCIYGIRDQTNFANITTATAITNVTATQFDIVMGATTPTTTVSSGIVYRVNGGNLPSALGAISQVINSLTRVSNVLTLTSLSNWAGFSVGDIINIAGCYDTSNVTMGVDGTYRITNGPTVTTLELVPVGSAPTGADIGSTNCGGAVVKRTAIRLSYCRATEYDPVRIDYTSRSSADSQQAMNVNLVAAPLTVTTSSVGLAAHDAVISGAPVRIGARALTSSYTAVSTGDTADLIATLVGALVVRPHCIPESAWSYAAATGGITNTTAVTVKAAAAAGICNYITRMQLQTTTLGVATEFAIRDGASGTVLWRTSLATVAQPLTDVTFDPPLRGTAATLIEVVALTNITSGAIFVNLLGYIAP